MTQTTDIFFDDISAIFNDLQSGDNISSIISRTIDLAAEVADADGCFFFHVTPSNYINLIHGRIKSLTPETTKTSNIELFESTHLPGIKNKKLKRPAEACAINKEIINSSNIYAEPLLETSLIKEFDELNNYTTISALIFPLFDSKSNVIGVAQFINARDQRGKIINFSIEKQEKIISLCQIIACILERKRLSESYTQLLESFVAVLAKAIDAKSPYTGLHCQKVPIITRMLAAAAVSEDFGALKNFDMSDDDWYALHIASWLHDCGKIVTPDYIVDKSAKLETVNNRIHEIRTRFEVLRRDAHIEYLQKRLQNIDTKENLQAEFVAKIKKLTEDFDFIGKCNTGEIPLTDQDLKRLDEISKLKFTRTFSRMVGLSWRDKKHIPSSEKYSLPEVEYVIQNRPEQTSDHYNQGELTNLKIPQGTINDEERKKINEHIVSTIDILKSLPFPSELENIVEFAGGHHERIDGKGYPKGLTGNQMSIPAKIIAIADIFEALTAKDRPYKKAKKLSEVLRIMQEMKNTGHIDPDLYHIFVSRGVYLDYAKEYIDKGQLDEFNPEEFL